MKEIVEGRLCTGCSACSQICPQSAILMAGSEEGFLYPQIDEERCTDCGVCVKTCPVNKRRREQLETPSHPIVEDPEKPNKSDLTNKPDRQDKTYACYSKNEDIRSKSTSGGVFTQLALNTLSENGVVFGAGFDENFKVHHAYIESKHELDGLRRSKYVQSEIGNAFNETKAFLREGRKVLFCGMPCQIAGLKAFLNKDDPNLLTCDMACHGVPSPKVWNMYLDYIRDKYKSGIKAVSFRDKATGWNSSSMKIELANGSIYSDKVQKEIFFIGFGKSIFNRKSCFDCQFRIHHTKADITLADYWGIDKQKKQEYTDNKGVSLVITHTAAGEEALSRINEGVCLEERSFAEAVQYNPRLVSSVGEPNGRKSFFDELIAGHSFDRLRLKYMDNVSLKYKAKNLLKRVMGRG